MRSQRQRPRRRGRHQPRILLDPDLWGLAAGSLGATLVLLADVLTTGPYEFSWHVLIGAGITFVVSYLGAGLFVWYLQRVRASEMEAMTDTLRRRVAAPEESPAVAQTEGQAEEGQ